MTTAPNVYSRSIKIRPRTLSNKITFLMFFEQLVYTNIEVFIFVSSLYHWVLWLRYLLPLKLVLDHYDNGGLVGAVGKISASQPQKPMFDPRLCRDLN